MDKIIICLVSNSRLILYDLHKKCLKKIFPKFKFLSHALKNLPAVHLHLPMIGAGLGGLCFEQVYNDLYRIFEEWASSALSVNIYGFTIVDYNLLKAIEKKAESQRKDLTNEISVVH